MMRGILGIALGALLLVGGCAQNTEQPARAEADQGQLVPTTTAQEQGTQGSQVYVWVVNAPGNKELPAPADSYGLGAIASALTTETQPAEETASCGFQQREINITITTGGTTPTVTGTPSVTVAGTQTPSAYPTGTPTQTVTPELGFSVPVAVAPGGVADVASSASGGSGSADTQDTGGSSATIATLTAAADRLASMVDALVAVLSKLPTATQPAE